MNLRVLPLLLSLACAGDSSDKTDTGDGNAGGAGASGSGGSDSAGGADSKDSHSGRSGDSAGGGDSAPPKDADGDGSPADLDCADTDATVFPGATEDCADGRENDCDGLLDCEDDDCSASEACAGERDCDDALDDDGDGLTDCDDDDCWGAACGVEVSRVRTGAMHVRRTTDRTPRGPSVGECEEWHTADETVIGADLNAVEGTAWTQSDGGAWNTCAWSVSKAHLNKEIGRGAFYRERTHSFFPSYGTTYATCEFVSSGTTMFSSTAPPSRTGFHIDAPCTASSAEILPQQLAVASLASPNTWLTQAGGVWYVGDAALTHETETTSAFHATSDWSINPLYPGEPYAVP